MKSAFEKKIAEAYASDGWRVVCAEAIGRQAYAMLQRGKRDSTGNLLGTETMVWGFELDEDDGGWDDLTPEEISDRSDLKACHYCEDVHAPYFVTLCYRAGVTYGGEKTREESWEKGVQTCAAVYDALCLVAYRQLYGND